jgi:ribonuclease HI
MYYAVAKGIKQGVYTSWNECKRNIEGYDEPIYKKFETEKEANDYIEEYINTLYVYTDGSCINNGSKNAKAGIGIYFSKKDERNVSKELTGENLTNNIAELTAIIEAINLIKKEPFKNKIIVTDSEYAIKCATTYGKKLEASNWLTTPKKIEPPNVELVKEIYRLTNKYSIQYLHIDAHTGNKDRHSIGNENADLLANSAISAVHKKKDIDKIYLDINFEERNYFKEKGAKWNPDKRKWFIYSDNQYKDEIMSKMTEIQKKCGEKIYLNVKFEDKNKAKEKGARWDISAGKWYIDESNIYKDYLIKTYK